jgi:hypothetical protein
MSNINTAAINVAYPVAGQDNDTQGFRDNFTNIVGALSTAKTEIGLLQTNSVLTASLDGLNATVTNNLGQSTLYNGILRQMYATTYSNSVSAPTFIDLNNGSLQSFTMTANVAFTFTNRPASGQYGIVRVMLSSDSTTERTASFYSANGGTIKYGNSGINPLGFDSPFQTPAQVSYSLKQDAPAAQNAIVLNSVQNIQPGLSVSGTNIAPSTIVTSVNLNTNTVVLSNNVLALVSAGTFATFSYSGPRVIEAWTNNGGTTVYLTQVADF